MKTRHQQGAFDVESLEQGRVIEFEYPVCNNFGVPLEFLPRRICVESVEHLNAPLKAADFIKRPYCRRGEVLVTGIDVNLDSLNYGKIERFYPEAMRGGSGEFASFRLGLFNPEEPGEMVDELGRVFGPTLFERQLMHRAVLYFQNLVLAKGGIELELGAWRAE